MPTPKSEPDRMLARYWRDYVDSGRRPSRYVARNLPDSLRAFTAVRRLPRIYPPVSADTPAGRELQRVIEHRGPLGLPSRWWGLVAVPVPASSLESPEAKRLRYNLRLARSEGITCRTADPGERNGLLEIARERERNHPDPTYRVTSPRNHDLLEHDLWIVAEDESAHPLMLTVVAVDGQFAVLRYFRTLGDGEKHSLSRYLAHQTIVEALAEKGVHWLLDTNPPAAQTNGVRLFQRIVGYRHVRVGRPSPLRGQP